MKKELMKSGSPNSLGIKEVQRATIISREPFSRCGTFSRIDEKREYRKGRGIVHTILETIVYFDCLHKATPETLGGACWKGTFVCNSCLVKCAEPSCGRMVCLARHCDCGARRDGILYCSRHVHTGLLGALATIFE